MQKTLKVVDQLIQTRIDTLRMAGATLMAEEKNNIEQQETEKDNTKKSITRETEETKLIDFYRNALLDLSEKRAKILKIITSIDELVYEYSKTETITEQKIEV